MKPQGAPAFYHGKILSGIGMRRRRRRRQFPKKKSGSLLVHVKACHQKITRYVGHMDLTQVEDSRCRV